MSLIVKKKPNNNESIFKKPYFLFLLIAIPFGIIFVFFTPPFQAPDEDVHFYRSYQLSEFQIISQKSNNVKPKIGAMLPSSLQRTVKNFDSGLPFHPPWKVKLNILQDVFSYPLNQDDKSFTILATAHVYSPVPYIASSAGILIGRLFELAPMKLLYLGRIFNLFAWTIIMYYAIKIIPIGKYLMMSLALMPMSLFIASTISADVITNSISYLVISFFLKLSYPEDRLSYFDVLKAAMLIALLSLTKQGYNLLCLLFLLIPLGKVSSRLRYFSLFVLIIMSALIPPFLWYQSIKHLLPAPKMPAALLGSTDILGIISYYSLTIIKDIMIHGTFYIQSFIGNLGHLDVPLPYYIVIGYFVLLIVLGITFSSNEKNISLRSRALMIAVFVISYFIIVMIFSGFYGDPVAYVVIGIQGRYFIPIALLLLMPLRSIRLSSGYLRCEKLSVFFILVSLIIACYEGLKVFYLS